MHQKLYSYLDNYLDNNDIKIERKIYKSSICLNF